MKINKFGFILSLLSFLCLASFSTGFDMYAHSVIYYIYDYPNTHAYLFFDKVVMPRYLLLSYIYEITRRLGIPIGVVVTFLVVYPAYTIGSYISNNTKRKSLGVSQILIVFSVFLLSLFYSGLSLVLLWLMTLLITRKKVFLLGVLFHPLGLVLGMLLTLFFKNYLKAYFFIVFTLFLSFYLLTDKGYFASSEIANIKYRLPLNKEETKGLLIYSFESKINEFYAMISILILSYLSKTKLKSFISYVKRFHFSRVVIIVPLFFLIVTSNIHFLSKNRHSLIIDTLSLNLSEPVYYTWYDWGSRDLSGSKQQLTRERDR